MEKVNIYEVNYIIDIERLRVENCEITDFFISHDNLPENLWLARLKNQYTDIVMIRPDSVSVNLYDENIYFDRQENTKNYSLFDVYPTQKARKKMFSVIAIDYSFVYKYIKDNFIITGNNGCYLKRRNASIKL